VSLKKIIWREAPKKYFLHNPIISRGCNLPNRYIFFKFLPIGPVFLEYPLFLKKKES